MADQNFFKTPVLFPYNGNILLDNASAFVPVPCNAPVEPPKTTAAVAKPKPPVLPAPAVTPPANQSSAHFVPKPKVGEIIKINNLYFTANSDSIPPNSLKALDDIFDYVGYGRRKPVDTNATREGRAKNQRVELKILSS